MKKPSPIFLYSLLFALALYHFHNWRSGGYTEVWNRVHFTPWPRVFRGPITCFDFSADFIRRLGYLGRFQLGQDSSVVARVPNSSPLYLFRRADHVFSQAQYGTRMRRKLIPAIEQALGEIQSKGVKVVLLPVPPKTVVEELAPSVRLESDQLYHQDFSTQVDPTENYKLLTSIAPETAVDLLKIYRNHLREGGAPVFLPWDFHWNSLGISLAAEGILTNLNARGIKSGPWLRESVGENDNQSNQYLLNHYQLPDFYLRHSRRIVWRETIYHLTESKPMSERAVSTGQRLILVGSSFCNRWGKTSHGLGNTLAAILNRPYINFCVAGGGLKGGWQKMRDEKFQWAKGDILVWELPFPDSVDDQFNFRLAPVSADSKGMLFPS